ncbi:MAG TPA: ABC transporter permease [Gemmatimonas sp.]|uniref:ABC transporter permease n=1 Tax=Gemmatimonas sp. TaxID=1962908 RepID=UPI002EDA2D22
MIWFAQRVARCLLVVALATTAGFVMLRLLPGDPLSQSIEQRGRTPEARAALRARYGLDTPLFQQATSYVARVVRGDLGASLVDGRPIAPEVARAASLSLRLALPALLGASLFGLLLGSARGWFAEHRVVRAAFHSVTALTVLPEFMLALGVLLLFAVKSRWFPVGGVSDPLIAYTGSATARLLDRVHHMVLPAGSLALAWSAAVARQQAIATQSARESLATRAAISRGVGPTSLWARYGARVAFPSSVTTIGMMFPALVSGTIVAETIFSWPGLGRLIVQGIGTRDYPLVVGALLVTSTLLAVASVGTDLLLMWADPRVAARAHRETAEAST